MKNNPAYIQYRKELEHEMDKKAQIIELLNIYGSFSISDNYTPLDINSTNPDVLFEITKSRLEYIKEIIELIHKRTDLGIFVYYAFKALFIGINDLKFDDNLNERKNYFNIILQCYMDNKMTQEMIKIVNELRENIGEKEQELFPFKLDNLYVLFIYVLIRINQLTTAELNEFLMRMLEKFYVVDFLFEDIDLKNIPHEQIINNLYKIFYVDKIINYFHLYIKNGELQPVPFTIEELDEYIDSSDVTIITKVNGDNNAKKKKEKSSKAIQKESKKDEIKKTLVITKKKK